ncbi:MAG: hypothetical protein AB7G37_06665 [Solirubrobacteraceae bacterium]
MSIRLKATALLATGAIAGGAATAIASGGDTTGRRTSSSTTPAAGHGYGVPAGQALPRGAHRDRRRGPATSGLADRLGITQEKLDAALAAIADERPARPAPADRRDEALDEMAKAIGVSTDDLRTALQALRRSVDRPARQGRAHRRPHPGGTGDRRARPHRRGDESSARPTEAERKKGREEFAAALAKRLKVDVDRVTTALKERHEAADIERNRLRREMREAREAFAGKLADELALPESKVAAALDAERPKRERGARPPHHRSPARG